jgi:nitrite reductase/ring-hydroxylating ferredoxin subunit
MAFRTVCKVSDIPVGQGKAFTVDGNKQLALFHLEDGFYATQRRCPHLFTPLEKGAIENGQVRCPMHRAEFDIRSGKVIQWASFPPVVAPLLNLFRTKKPLTTYPTKVEGEDVQVDI